MSGGLDISRESQQERRILQGATIAEKTVAARKGRDTTAARKRRRDRVVELVALLREVTEDIEAHEKKAKELRGDLAKLETSLDELLAGRIQ